MSDESDEKKAYFEGRRSAFRQMLQPCIAELEPGPEREAAIIIGERVDAIAVLRRLCAKYGDNDWTDNLHLGDIIEKHLGKYLEDPDGRWDRG